MPQGVAALKLKSNLYFLISLHTQCNKQMFWLWTQCFPHENWMKDCPVWHMCPIQHLTYNYITYIYIYIYIHINKYICFSKYFHNKFLTMLMSITDFQKLVNARIWKVNKIFCWIKAVVCCHSTIFYYKYKKLDIVK